jgi:serine/threonine-protein kinase HipA
MQLKLSVLLRDEKLTLSATGAGGRYILKMPPTTLPRVPRNEHVVMSWARAAGVDAAKTKLVPVRDVAGLPAGLPLVEDEALLVERFDRPLGKPKIHQEDFAQVLGKAPGDKYGREAGVSFDGLGKVIAAVAGRADFEAFLVRLVFCVLCNNPDAHLKNWSFWYPDRKRPRLSPAYDLVSAALYPGVDRQLACRLAGEWEMSRLRSSHFGVLASHAGLSVKDGVALAEQAATQIRDAWQRMPETLEVPADLARAVDAHLATISLP